MAELGIQGFWQFVLGTVLIVLLPGPNSLYVLTTAATRGRQMGWRAAWGIFAGDGVLMIATASGAASLMVLLPEVFAAVKVLGAVYLGWIGVGLLRTGIGQWNTPARPFDAASQALPIVASTMTAHAPFWRALALSLTNPKAILFFVAYFTQFVAPDADSPALAYLVLGLVVQACSLSYLCLLIVAGQRLRQAFVTHPRRSALGIVLVSLCFIGFAGHMLT
jgi:leucine efflux protein